MKKLIFAVALIWGAAASAADFPQQPPVAYPAPAPVYAPAFNWSGFYIGAMGGYGWSDKVRVGGITINDTGLKGGFAGGTIGGNLQAGQFVVGLEADAAWSNINETDSLFGVTAKDQIKAFGSVTARGGFAVDRLLIYGKGGYAWANNEISASALGLTIAESHFHNGWTVGGGLEYAFAGPWSVKGEYMFARYLDQTYLASLGGVTLGFDVHTVKAGVNYRFGTAY